MEVRTTKKDVSNILKIVSRHSQSKQPLLDILHETQNQFGYIPLSAMKLISDELKIPIRDIETTATFYDFFYIKPNGKTVIRICEGASCVVNGSEELSTLLRDKLKLEDNENTTADGQYTLEVTYCNGHCDCGPTITLNDSLYTDVDVFTLGAIIGGQENE